VKRFVLFDHDGVLVDTELWYFRAAERALASVGFVLDLDQYLRDMSLGLGSWASARAAGVSAETVERLRPVRDAYYRSFLRTEDIEIPGVLDVLASLSAHVRMAIVTTSKRADFELIHAERRILSFMDFVLVREDYERAKPDPEPYLLGLQRFGAAPASTLVVEDSARGLASAVAAGLDCAVVHNDFTAGQDFSGARYRIGSLAELEDIVLGA
jgi:HAD superfamily hydrolase (TIGR01509 family)